MKGKIPGFGGPCGSGNLSQDQVDFGGIERPPDTPERIQGEFAREFFHQKRSGAFGVESQRGEEVGILVGTEGRPGFFEIGQEEVGGQEIGRRQELDVDRPARGALGAAVTVRIGSVRGAAVEGKVVAEDFGGFGTVGKMGGEGQAGAVGRGKDFRARREFGGEFPGTALGEGPELFERPGVMGLGGLENGIEEETQFGREVLCGAGSRKIGKPGGALLHHRAGQHVEQEPAGFVDGPGFHELWFRADGNDAGEAEVADFDGEIVRMGACQGEAGMEDFDPGEEAGVAGEGGESFHELADDEQGEPGWQRMTAGQPGVEALAVEKFGDVIVGTFIFAAFDDAQQVAMAEGGGELHQILETGRIAGALGRGDGDVEFHKLALFVIEGQAGDFVRAPPDFDGGSMPVLTDGVVAESLEGGHGAGQRESGINRRRRLA